jgi:hypothetical protein
MPQIGEAFNVALILDSKMDCPFSHEDVEKLTIENDLIGVGSTLQTRLKGPTPTYHKNSPVFEKEKNKILNPKDVAKHPFHRKNQPAIRLDLGRKGEDDVDIVAYKVSCAAHHLIPAQESLKQSKLEEYLLKKGTTGPGGRAGKCRDDVGYDVNGSQNGVYLPGPYAVTGKKAGRKKWIPLADSPDAEWPPPSDDEDEAEDYETDVDKSMLLTGGVTCKKNRSRKWLYVREVTKLARGYTERGYGGQFHDRHQLYSYNVAEALDTLHAMLQKRQPRKNVKSPCSKCEDQKKKQNPDDKVPTPFALVTRLNKMSDRLEGKVKGSLYHPGLCTSAWGEKYIEAGCPV